MIDRSDTEQGEMDWFKSLIPTGFRTGEQKKQVIVPTAQVLSKSSIQEFFFYFFKVLVTRLDEGSL